MSAEKEAPVSEKDKEYKQSIMDDIYNDISSDEDEEEDFTAQAAPKAAEETTTESETLESKDEAPEDTKTEEKKVEEADKKEALRALYSDEDSDDSGDEKKKAKDNDQNQPPTGNVRSAILTKVGGWYNFAKDEITKKEPQISAALSKNTKTVMDQFHKVTSDEVPVQTDLNSFMQDIKEEDDSSIKVQLEVQKKQIQLVKQAPSFTIDEDAPEAKIEIKGEGEEFSDDEQEESKVENDGEDMLLEEKTEASLKIEQNTVKLQITEEQPEPELKNLEPAEVLTGEPLLEKGQIVAIEDYMMQNVRKEAKRANLFAIVSTTEPRMLTVLDGCLYVFKPIPIKNKVMQSMGRFFAKQMPDQDEIDQANKPKATVKSVSKLDRLFKVDIQGATSAQEGQEIQLLLHFVNKERDPLKAPVVKKYWIKLDKAAKVFFRQFENLLSATSSYYQLSKQCQSN